ncbi:phage tail protein [Diaphorobacter sp. HDW4A]|uniref:tail protein X n=1 Tax=Diaphorobacter sp. HDW4A TaxID=2714924 RepID=UPI00140C1B87|nr:tail protein X [Diaphorobacter sp. HDW4A]QIL80827.1 phage tail protein [Diaphorobacter sp. HDW4A]
MSAVTSNQSATVRAHQHEVLDALMWRTLGKTAGNLEATLEANPGLAKIATDLPEGHPVRVVESAEPVQERVYLWD